MVKMLLIDPNDDNPRWIIDWVASELDPGEKELLADLETRFMAVEAEGVLRAAAEMRGGGHSGDTG